jgi:hypothetical protein
MISGNTDSRFIWDWEKNKEYTVILFKEDKILKISSRKKQQVEKQVEWLCSLVRKK